MLLGVQRVLPLLASLACLGGLAACSREFPPLPDLAGAEHLAPPVRDAIEQARAAVEADPDDAALRFELAALLDAHGLHGVAEQAYAAVTALEPGHAQAWYHRGRMQFELGDPEAALRSMEHAAALAPGHAPTHWRQGTWLVALQRRAAAAACFQRAAEADPDDPGGWLGLARLALDDGRADEAAALLEKVLAVRPDHVQARRLLSAALLRTGETARAGAIAPREGEVSAPEEDPWVAAVRARRVGTREEKIDIWARLEREGPGRMIPELEALHAEHPDDLGVLGSLSSAYCAAGLTDRALALLAGAEEHLPQHPRVALMTALVLEIRGELDQALEHTRRAIGYHPEFAPAHFRLGQLLANMGRGAEAITALQEALRLGFADESLFLLLGVLQRTHGRSADGVATLERAVREHPRSTSAALFLAKACAEVGRFETARAELARARELDPTDPRLAEFAARVEQMEGRSRP